MMTTLLGADAEITSLHADAAEGTPGLHAAEEGCTAHLAEAIPAKAIPAVAIAALVLQVLAALQLICLTWSEQARGKYVHFSARVLSFDVAGKHASFACEPHR